ncbi:MAG: GNAT family N-acetyltransferase [Planctomycetes bacterium]|nr:GNAT family N-acetyltransferase [Planctomycetota bacterium]
MVTVNHAPGGESIVRSAAPADVEPLVALGRRNYEEQLAADPDFRLAEGWETHYADLLRAMLSSPAHLVKVAERESDKTLIGFVTGMLAADPTWADQARGTVLELYVDPAHRRRGIGRRLAVAALDHFAGAQAGLVLVNVFRSNAAGERLWRSVGFTPFMTRLKMRPGSRPGAP